VVPNLRYLLCVRNPLDVAESLQRREHLPVSRATALWQEYNERALRTTPRQALEVVVYEDVLADYRKALNPLLEWLGLASIKPGSAIDIAVGSFVDPSLQHHRHSLQDVLESDVVPADAKQLYDVLLHRRDLAAGFSLSHPIEEFTPGRRAPLKAELAARVAEMKRATESLTTQTLDKDRYMEDLTAQTLDRDGRISALTVQVLTQKRRIDQLQDELSARELAVNSILVQIRDRDQAIQTLASNLRRREMEVESLAEQIAGWNQRWAGMQQSLSWSLLERLRHLRQVVAPRASKREQLWLAAIRKMGHARGRRADTDG
jgi:hypothetical protein